MKTTVFILSLFLCLGGYAQTVSPDSAKYHEGELTTVCGKCVGTYTTKKGMTFLNFDQPYPISPFTAVIFASDSMNFEKSGYYKGKRLCVMGKVKMYNGKPEIILKKANQIRFPDGE
jgi:hypothetical protein